MTNSRSASSTKCDVDASLLLVVDIQTNLGGAMPNKVLNRVVLNTTLLSRSADLLQVPVIRTEQYPKGLGATVDEVLEAMPSGAESFEKTIFSSVAADGVMEAIEQSGRRQIVLVGMEAHVCVLQSALDLLDADFQVYVVEDAVCSRRLENYQNALDRLRQSDVGIVSAESVIFEWLVHSRHEHFKAISAMLR